MNCIYCHSTGPFNQEHVIPVSLGGDDRPDWVLKNCVCEECNSSFKVFEGKATRQSEIAVARKELQEHTRSREKPTINFESSFFYDKKTGIILENETIEGNIYPASQLLIYETGEARYIGDRDKYSFLIEKLRQSIREGLTLIQKNVNKNSPKHKLIKVLFKDKSFETIEEFSDSLKIEGEKIFIEPFELPEEYSEYGEDAFPQRFCIKNGIINARVSLIEFLLDFIIGLTNSPNELPETGVKEKRDVISVSTIDFDGVSLSRLYAKIGLNLIAKIYGAEVAHKHNFDRIRNFVRYGKGTVDSLNTQYNESSLGNAVENYHIFSISIIKAHNLYNLVLNARLYDVTTQRVVLGSFESIPNFYSEDVFIHCNYNKNKIEIVPKYLHKELTMQSDEKMPASLIIWIITISIILIVLLIAFLYG